MTPEQRSRMIEEVHFGLLAPCGARRGRRGLVVCELQPGHKEIADWDHFGRDVLGRWHEWKEDRNEHS